MCRHDHDNIADSRHPSNTILHIKSTVPTFEVSYYLNNCYRYMYTRKSPPDYSIYNMIIDDNHNI